MVLIFGFALIALLAFANGANDVSKSVATLAGSGVADYRRALRWGALWTTAGALLGGLFAGSLADRFARSLGPSTPPNAAVPLAVAAAALGWVALASRVGWPVSTTHALTGALLGAGWVAGFLTPQVGAEMVRGFILPLAVSPLVSVGLTLLLGPVAVRAGRWLESRCVCAVPALSAVPLASPGPAAAAPALSLVVDRQANCQDRSAWSWNFSLTQAHWLSSGLVSLSRGMNDAPKIWALTLPLMVLGGSDHRSLLPVAILMVALAMGLGSWIAGRKVSEVLAERVTRIGQESGFAANLATALLVTLASRLGLPVSTTHVSSGAIVGIGLAQGRAALNKRTLGEFLLAWVLTLPAGALLAIACLRIFQFF